MELHLSDLRPKAMGGRPTCTHVCGVPVQSRPWKRCSPHAPPLHLSRGKEVAGGWVCERTPLPSTTADPRAPEHSTLGPFSDLPLHVLTKMLVLSHHKIRASCRNCLYVIITTAAAAAAKSLQSCPTLCNPIDGSPPGSPVPRILQARTLEWVAISFSNA